MQSGSLRDERVGILGSQGTPIGATPGQVPPDVRPAFSPRHTRPASGQDSGVEDLLCTAKVSQVPRPHLDDIVGPMVLLRSCWGFRRDRST